MMPAYCDVDGVPCHASHELLTSILRDEWGFDGIVASDYTAVQMLVGEHRLTGDLGSRRPRWRCARASTAELPTTAAYGGTAGRGDRGRSGRRVARGPRGRADLRLKFRLGLFDRPYVDAPSTGDAGPARCGGARARCPARRAVGRAARERRRAAAPRRTAARIAVIGPIADSARDLMGDYAHMLHIETLAELRHQANPFGFPSSRRDPAGRRVRRAAHDPGRAARPVRRKRASRHAHGSGIREGTDDEIAAAVELAAVVDGRDRHGRRAVGPHLRRHHRRVARPPGPHAARSPAGAGRGRGRDRDAGRSWSSSAGARWRSSGRRRTAPRSCSRGCPASPAPRRSPRSSPATPSPGGKPPDHDAARTSARSR